MTTSIMVNSPSELQDNPSTSQVPNKTTQNWESPSLVRSSTEGSKYA